MQRWMSRLQLLACGGITLGVLQAIQNIDLNQIWFLLWYMIVTAFVSALFGGDASLLTGTPGSSLFGGFPV